MAIDDVHASALPGRGLAMPATLRPFFAWFHAGLLIALVALRPLIWDGEIGNADQLVYAGLVVLALAVTVAESWCGLRARWRWGPAGLAAAALVLWLAWPAWSSPLGIEGMATWSSLALHLGLAIYLAQAVHGRERLLLAALAAGLVGELAAAAGQWAWGLPALQAQLAAGGLDLGMIENRHGDLANRLAHGGIFGTFTQANALAAYLLVALPVVVHAAGRSDAAHGPRAWVLVIAVIGALIFLAAGSKGAVLCLTATGVLAGIVTWRDWRRWTLVALAASGGVLLWAVPMLRGALAASSEVRIGYWQAALRLIGEAPGAGHGVRGYAAHMARTAPEWAEPTRYVHNEVLEAAVSGGLPAALLALLAGTLLLRPPAPLPAPLPATTSERRSPWLLVFLLPYLHVFGLLDLSTWPGGSSLVGTLIWTATIAVAMALTARAVLRLPLPGSWPLRLGLGALAAHCLIDFDLHAGGVLGTLVAVAVLAGTGNARSIAVTTPRLVLASLAMLTAIGLFIATLPAAQRAHNLRQIAWQGHAALIAMQRRSGDLDGLARGLAYSAQLEHSDEGPMNADRLRRLLADAHAAAWPQVTAWPGVEPDTAIRLAQLLPRGRERHAASGDLVIRLPWNASVHALHAEDLHVLGRYAEAAASWRAAMARSPSHLPYQVALAVTLDAQAKAKATPAEAAALRAEAQRLREDAAEREPRVHLRNRR